MEAYWHLSAKRFDDNCCMLADKDILCKLPSLVQDNMYQFIKDDVKLQEYFAENPVLVKQRNEAEERKDRLLRAASKFNAILVAPPQPPSQQQYQSKGGAINMDNCTFSTNDNRSALNQDRWRGFESDAEKTLYYTITPGENGLGLTLSPELNSANKFVAIKGSCYMKWITLIHDTYY